MTDTAMNIGTTPTLLAFLLLAAHGSSSCDDKAKTTPSKLQGKQTRAAVGAQVETELLNARNKLKETQSMYNASCKRSEKLSGEMVKLERRKYKLTSKIAQKAQGEADIQSYVLAQAHKGRYPAVNSLDDAMREVIAKHRKELSVQSMLLSEIECLNQTIQRLMSNTKSLKK